MPFDDSEFAPLDDFPLLWRWTTPSRAVLPAEVLGQIRPLGAEAAARLAPDARDRCRATVTAGWSTVIAAESERYAPVRVRLQALPVEPATHVVVSWDQATAIVVPWGVFVDYWTDFCYPSSDDVTVWVPAGEWTLCYHHFGVFEFGPAPGAA